MRVSLRFFALGTMVAHTIACHNVNNALPSGLPRDEWAISGRMGTGGYRQGKILALGIDGTRYSSTIHSDNFFSIQLPGNTTYALHFMAPPQGEEGTTRANTAILTFDSGRDVGKSDTLRLPKPTQYPYLDLGIIDIKHKTAFSTQNPSRQLDADMDGIEDFFDPDDQNDGLSDEDQKFRLELVGICHKEKGKEPKSMRVPLSSLLNHLNHRDSFGPCQKHKK